MSVHFVHNMIKDKVPAEPADFTRALPQHISLKILSYLDPRTLAQASLVSQTQGNVFFLWLFVDENQRNLWWIFLFDTCN